MGFQVAMPPEGQVFDFMFDYDNIRWVFGSLINVTLLIESLELSAMSVVVSVFANCLCILSQMGAMEGPCGCAAGPQSH